MATIKVACPKCGQKVSGDESFYGTTVECPVCSADILFPGERRDNHPLPPTPSQEASSHPIPVASSQAQDRDETPARDYNPERRSENPPTYAQPTHREEEYDEPPLTSLWGMISMVTGVLAVITCIGGPVFAPLAIAFGHTAVAKARHSKVQPAPGQTLGAIGLTIGYASLATTLLVLIVLIFFGESIKEWYTGIQAAE